MKKYQTPPFKDVLTNKETTTDERFLEQILNVPNRSGAKSKNSIVYK